MKDLDLYKVLPEGTNFDFEDYISNENKVLTPAVLVAGFTSLGRWYTAEGDSFGPLSRAISANSPEGSRVVLSYG